MPATKGRKTEKFEEALKKLEKLVTELEDGDLSLDEAIKAFEAGSKLVKTCEERLAEARQKIEVLMGEEIKALNWKDDDSI